MTTITSTEGVDTTSHTVNLPSGIIAGQLLGIWFSWNATSATPTLPEGWAQRTLETSSNSGGTLQVRQADGTEGGSITVTTDVACKSCAVAFRVSPARDFSNANTTGLNPPAVVGPRGGGIPEDHLGVVATAYIDGTITVTGFPSTFDDNQADLQSDAAADGVGIGFGTVLVNTDIIDPTTFTLSGATGSVVISMLVALEESTVIGNAFASAPALVR